MRRLQQTSSTLRLFGASVSLAITIGMFFLLRATQPPFEARRAELNVPVFVLGAKPTAIEVAPTRPAAAKERPSLRGSPAPAARGSPPSPLPRTEVPGPAPDVPMPPSARPPLESTPLKIDAQAIGRAIAGTRGVVRQMARTSGAELDSPRSSRSEQLGAALAEGAIPDCLAANAGGSLLSIPIIAYLAIEGRCK